MMVLVVHGTVDIQALISDLLLRGHGLCLELPRLAWPGAARSRAACVKARLCH